jgi:hypothetical protein
MEKVPLEGLPVKNILDKAMRFSQTRVQSTAPGHLEENYVGTESVLWSAQILAARGRQGMHGLDGMLHGFSVNFRL